MTHLFPKFHVRPHAGFVNDPNGPIVIDDEVHLYFQYRVDAGARGPVSWGHVSSPDFVRWSYHRPAMAPVPFGPDRDGCWSGNTVVGDDGIVRAFYSGLVAENPFQSVLVAESRDRGMTFGSPRLAVEDPRPEERVRIFRDPFVWRRGGEWRMVVGCGDADGRASMRTYRSRDLARWDLIEPFATMPRRSVDGIDTGAMWECPQVLTFDGSDVALVSSFVEGRTFGDIVVVAPEPHGEGDPAVDRYDHGGCLYAASALRESPYGPIVWGWVTEARSPQWATEGGWSGMLSLPRAVSWEGGRLRSRPLPAMASLRLAEHVIDGGPDHAAVRGLGAQAEIELSLAPGSAGTELRLLFSESERVTIEVDRDRGAVTIDTTRASSDQRSSGAVRTWIEPTLAAGNAFEVRAFLDGSVIEVFTSSGTCATVRAYPVAAPPWSVETDARGGIGVRAWELSPHG